MDRILIIVRAKVTGDELVASGERGKGDVKDDGDLFLMQRKKMKTAKETENRLSGSLNGGVMIMPGVSGGKGEEIIGMI